MRRDAERGGERAVYSVGGGAVCTTVGGSGGLGDDLGLDLGHLDLGHLDLEHAEMVSAVGTSRVTVMTAAVLGGAARGLSEARLKRVSELRMMRLTLTLTLTPD